jgi:PAS domain S-box-containing protein
MHDGLVLLDATGRAVLVNDAAAAQCGLTRAEALNATLEDWEQLVEVRDLADRPVPTKQWPMMRVLQGERIEGVELRLMRKDTRQSWFIRYSGEPVRDADGCLRYALVVSVDVTERFRSREEQSDSEQRLRVILDAARAGTFDIEEGEPVPRVSEGLRTLFGFASDDAPAVGDYLSRVHPEDAERVRETIEGSIAEGRGHYVEYRIVRGAEELWVASRAEFVAATGSRSGRLIGVVMDITERQRSLQAKIASEERLRALANSLPQLVWTADEFGRVDFYNARAQEYLGFTEQSDRTWTWVPALHPDDLAHTVEAWNAAVHTGTEYACEHRVQMADGSYRWHISRARRVSQADGHRWFGSATDIHTQKLTEERLAQAVAIRDQVMSLVSHDLRNPLSVARACVPLLSRILESCEPESARARGESCLVRLDRQVTKMNRMLNELLDTVRLRVGQPLDLTRERTDLARLVRNVAEEHERTAAMPRVVVAEAPAELEGEWDTARLERVVDNLVSNALKYSTEPARVTLSLYADGVEAVLEVADQGVGIPAQEQGRIFDWFSRAANAPSAVAGAGLGLAGARQVVLQHGGTISVRSEVGVGSTFTVRLPRQPASVQAEPSRFPSQPPPGAQPSATSSERELEASPPAVDPAPLPPQELSGADEVFAHRVLNSLFAFVGLLEPNGTVLDANEAPLVAAGLTIADVRGRKFWDCPWWSYDPAVQERLRRACEAAAYGGSIRYDEVIRVSGDRRMIIDFQIVPLVGGSGRVTHLIPSAVDVTERKRVERALDSERSKLASLVDALPVGLAVVEGTTVTVNAAMLALHGLSAVDEWNRVLPRYEEHFELRSVSGAGPSAEWPLLRALRGEPVEEQDFELTLRATGARRTVAMSTASHVGGRDDHRTIVLLSDVTEQRAASDALREADQRKDQFIATLAHELRNPLAPIRTAVAVLERIGPVDERVERVREIVTRQVAQMARLVDDLLEVSRLTRGKLELHAEACELRAELFKIVQDHRPTFERSQRELVLHVEGDIVVWADPVRLRQMVENLLDNALRFTAAGGKVEVSASSLEGAADACIHVHDDGVGISPELLPSLFGSFSQASQGLARTKGGLGLGLTMTRMLAELHGGSVSALSPGVGHGATFIIRLPLSARDASEAAPRSANQVPSSQRILIVEDNADAAELLAELLNLLGHEVRVAYDGTSGLATAEGWRPDVVVSDIGLPGEVDGYALAARLRRDGPRPPPRLVALSGYGDDESRRRSEEAGFHAHLVKPVTLELLQSALAGRSGRRPSDSAVD